MSKQASLTDYKLEHKKEKVKYPKKNVISSKFTFIEMFSGIAGFRLGLERSGWKCVWANDNNKYANKIYHIHYGYGELDEGNIRRKKAERIPDHTLLTAGFPCQSFSVAGKGKGFKDTRGTLFYEICRIAKAKKPTLLLLENVKGLLSNNKGETFRTILSSLDELGYNAEWQVLNSKDFGVPQSRQRVFIVGYLRGASTRTIFPIRETNKLPKENGKRKERITSCLDANYYKGARRQRTFIIYRGTKKANIKNRIRETKNMPTLESKGSYWGIVNKPLVEHKKITERSGEWGSGFKEDETFCLDSSSGRDQVLHLENAKIRRLTPTECERLQGFPDGWTKWLSDTQRYKALGNAVTVNVIEYLGKLLKECLR